jgi:hypothetical protein
MESAPRRTLTVKELLAGTTVKTDTAGAN